MNNNALPAIGHSLEFIDPIAKFWMRFGLSIVAIVLAFLTLRSYPRHITNIGTGEVNHSRQIEVYSMKRPPDDSEQSTSQPASENVVEHNQYNEQKESPDTKSISENQHSTEPSSAKPKESFSENNAELLDSSQQQDPFGKQSEQFEIIAGETAPAYEVADAGIYDYLAKNHGCRFIITDEKLSIELGRSTQSNSMRTIGSEWNEIYSKRKVRIPMSSAIRKAVMAAGQRYKLQPDAKCYLCVPHNLDRAIFVAQMDYLGPDWDVTATTEIDFRFGRPVVNGVIESADIDRRTNR